MSAAAARRYLTGLLDETGPAETLTSVRIGDQWHAIYPTATKTLCGLDSPGLKPGRKWAPDCGACGRLARRFHRIDGSMPEHWLPEVTA